ncbi:hypothetical protein [Filimonas effusa]|uniref:Uncharacterized protein n=1 Tax=Filimonas effusa TaxID=2508721 RepID=A0A4Q1DAW1_9BACT|nr:hypothetical protein [Filimonas effusa]RXK85905.1 hypothetical protein ESB13_03590 [Filimonas effusa]
MISVFSSPNKSSLLVLLLLLSILCSGRAYAQCDWNITTTTEASVCKASGKIAVTLTGAGVTNFTDVLYSLEPLDAGGSVVPPVKSPVFDNLLPGLYRVKVEVVCNNVSSVKYVDVRVSGSTYVAPSVSIAQYRPNLPCGAYGQANVVVTGSNPPFQLNIVGPPGYTGETSFTFPDNTRQTLNNLATGSYSVTITDACNQLTPAQSFIINEIEPQSTTYFVQRASNSNNDCKSVVLTPPFSGSDWLNYVQARDVNFSYSVSYENQPKLPYKRALLSSPDSYQTLQLPTGQTLSSLFDKSLTYYLKFECGTEVQFDRKFPDPWCPLEFTDVCSNGFIPSISVRFIDDLICYPVHVIYENKSTLQQFRDTINAGDPLTTSKQMILPYGQYQVTVQAADGGYYLKDEPWDVWNSSGNPYSLGKNHNNGHYGNDGAGLFYLTKQNGGSVSPGTRIQLISQSAYAYDMIVKAATYSYDIILSSIPGNPDFTPGNYLFRVTDECGSYDLPVVLEEKDVFRYSFDFSLEDNCQGMKVSPNGSYRYYGNTNANVSYQMVEAPAGTSFYPNRIDNGGSFQITVPGTYRIAIAAPGSVWDYGDKNSKTIVYTPNPLTVDVKKSIGWVCPRQPLDQGNIWAVGAGGVPKSDGQYTYKLAAEGQGGTGPYLATNNTGRFSTNSGGTYTLRANENYDIRVEDDCGAATVQTIKVLDYGTAQIAYADKSSYCIGETIRLSVLNLPATLQENPFRWTGPDNFASFQQNPSFKAVTTSAGTYHIKVFSDICGDPIENDVIVRINPTATICYSSVTDTVVNPYVTGLLGNWRSEKSLLYYTNRENADPLSNLEIRRAGAYADFSPYWNFGVNKLAVNADTTRWVWNAAINLFNNNGAELENKDPLGRYNSGLYGYNNTLPIAVIQNGRYSENAFEGFEDYGFGGVVCDNECAGTRHIDFSAVRSAFTSSTAHTGKYAIVVTREQPITIGAEVSAPAPDTFNLAVNYNSNYCIPSGRGLDGIRTGKDALLPIFKPVKNTKLVFCAWVKEEQPCKGVSYTDNNVLLTVQLAGGGAQSVVCSPAGAIIEGWQRYEQVIELPETATSFAFSLQATGSTRVFYDDIRLHPYNANMKSFVYDPVNLRLMAELDENNYASFFEYDDDGTLIRVKKETERGIQTIKETRSALLKE